MSSSPHTNATGCEDSRSWTAAGAVRVIARRTRATPGTPQHWTLEDGPAPLIGRTYRTIAQARHAVSSWGRSTAR